MLQWIRVRSAIDVYLVLLAFLNPWQSESIIRRAITPFHILNVFLLLLLLFSLRLDRIRLYFVVPFLIYMLGGVLGMFSSEVVFLNTYTLAQDVYLYIWFSVMCVLLQSERRDEHLVTAWICSVLLIITLDHVIGLGMSSRRAEFSFANPSRAGSYFAFTFFFLFHPVIPRVFKIIGGAAIFMAIGATGSRGGFLMWLLGSVIFVWAWVYVRTPRGLRPLQHLGFGLLVVVGVYTSDRWAGMDPLTRFAAYGSPLVAERLETSDSGLETREENWAAGLETFREHPMGIGPLSWQNQVEREGQDQKGAHSDFFASLVERGVVGFIGFLLFLGAITVKIFKMLRLYAHRGDRRRGIWAAALTAAFIGYVSYGTTHEMLHHETFWLLLALIVSHATSQKYRRAAVVAHFPGRERALPPIKSQVASARGVVWRKPASPP